MTRRGLALALATALFQAPAFAAFPDLGAGARAPGMGNAFTGIADDINAYHYNPAGLGNLRRPQFNTTYSRLHMGLSDGSNISLAQLAYAHPLKKNRGTLALAYHQLSLSGLYGERSIYASYGKQVLDDLDKGTLFVGGSLKHLTLSFDRPAEAANSFCTANPLDQACGADPVLSGDTSKSVFDLDLGLLYRYQYRYFLGLAIRHLNEPDVSFSGNKAPIYRGVRLALGYRALWLNLTTELKLDKAPDGGSDKKFILGAERFFPTLHRGQVGLRGSLGLGDRDFRQLTTGLTYRINKIQFDYAFIMPLGTVGGAAGSHRLGLTLHFGAPTPEEQYTADLIEKIELAKTPSAGYAYEFEDLPSPLEPVLDSEGYASVKKAIADGRYDKALEILVPHLEGEAVSIALVSLGGRLQEVRYFFRSVDPLAGEWAAVLHRGITHFLHGRDDKAVLVASYALTLKKDARRTKLPEFVARLEEITKIKAERMPEGTKLSLLQLKLNESETLFLTRNFKDSRKLALDALVLHPNHPVALARIGSSYYMEKKYEESVAYWKRALTFETDGTERETLKFMLLRAHKKLAPLKEEEAEAAKKKWRAKPSMRRVDPKLLERLYQLSVEQYSRGDWDKVAESLEKILALEPSNRQARRALRRLEGESMQRGGRGDR